MMNEPQTRPVKTAETSFALLEQLSEAEGDSLGVTELAEQVGLAKSTVHRHVVTLESLGFVAREGNEYRIGLRLLDFGLRARDRHDLYHIARPKVEELAEVTGEKVWCITEEQGRSVHLYGASGEHSVQTSARAGAWGYLHQHAAGKAILAHLPADRVRRIVDGHGLPAKTPDTITDETELFEQLEQIVDRGYAFNREESIAGLHAVGAPVTDDEGVAIGAISVSGPANRLKGTRLTDELPDLLLGATNEIEINLSFS
ncbi:transcriptional regulator, IclR family [Halogranum amylolyticum]|uniref:Transcriptional regulator, IclR family n=1 Tax=Halogranum amylolyticum TaxID=660520 RepID=A0A1H8WTW7_9EURY|nr:IclR family transcriptional regulator [Halogranum amylolyticum]SEP31124.1 transcriptional regulator, IclR family [Halogranum amylolyticum]